MSRIPRTSRGKRPGFFKESAVDQMVTMMLELMTEVWVVKERVYALEKILGEEGIDASGRIEASAFSAEETTELEEKRQEFIQGILRSLETNFVDRSKLQEEIDEMNERMEEEAGAA